MVGEWVLALIILGVCILIILGLALFTAFSFQKIADKGTYIGFDENGVGYWVPVQDAEEDEEDKEDDDEGKIYVLLKCDEFKFVKPVLPGDTLTIEVIKDGGGAGLVKFDCKAFVDGELRAKGKLAFCAVDKANIYG